MIKLEIDRNLITGSAALREFFCSRTDSVAEF